jgi:hypothetical protein
MSMDVEDDDVPGIPQLSLHGSDKDDGNDIHSDDYDADSDRLDRIRELLHCDSTSAPMDGPKIRQAAITDEYEEDMAMID